MIDARRFPPPWSVEETDACFIVRDHNGQALAYVYFEDEPGRRAAAKLLTRDGARRMAVNFAKLPELLHGPLPISDPVTRCNRHASRQSAQCRLRPQRKYRRNAISVVMGQQQTHAAQQINFIIRSPRQREPRASEGPSIRVPWRSSG